MNDTTLRYLLEIADVKFDPWPSNQVGQNDHFTISWGTRVGPKEATVVGLRVTNKRTGYVLNLEGDEDIIYALDYWDCECDEDYIHPITESHCKVCGSVQDEQPTSRLEEVMKHIK